MSMTVEVPEPLAGRLAAAAARRGVSVDRLAIEALEGVYGRADADDALAAFIGSVDSGDPDWASTDTQSLRAQVSARRPA
jgi:hypothetical protein